MDLNQLVSNVVLAKVCSIKPDKDSDTSKSITLKVKFDGVTLKDVFAKALSSAVIQWQNGPGRNGFDKWTNNQVVNVDFKAPGRQPTLSPMEQFKLDAKAAGVDITDKRALTAYIEKQLETM